MLFTKQVRVSWVGQICRSNVVQLNRVRCMSAAGSNPDLPALSDIRLFYEPSCSRELNHSNNIIRERILHSLFTMPADHDYLNQCARWRDIYDKLNAALPGRLQGAQVSMAGGRGHNYDFMINGELIEFKYGANRFQNLPQILSVQTRWDHDPLLGPNLPQVAPKRSLPYNLRFGRSLRALSHPPAITYTKFFYYQYLPHIAYLSSVYVPRPLVYRREVAHVAPRHPFFKALKRRQNKETHTISDKSIHDYLQALRASEHQWDWQHLSPAIERQNKKTFMFWDPDVQDFTIDKPKIIFNPYATPSFKRGKTGLFNTLVIPLDSQSGELLCLLRWKNHKGVQNPAWQIKYIPYA